MIWHIFRKDLRLLWHFAAGVAAIGWIFAILTYQMDHNATNLRSLWGLVEMLRMLSSGVLVATVVHLDAIPGVRQDWLIRPIRRWDLLLAKLFFVLVMVQGPIFLADLVEALADGFPAGQAFGAALIRSIFFFALLYVPILAFASVTRNFTESIIGAVAFVALFGLLIRFANMLFPAHWRLFGTAGVDWLPEVAALLIAALGVAAILALQYFRRRTTTARWLTAVAGLLCLV